jgi:hypothetical protein
METLIGTRRKPVVSADDTAEALGSADVAMLATPRLSAWLGERIP